MTMWMVWAVAVTALLGASALLAESALRARGWPGRWPWLVALAASMVLTLHALIRPAPAVDPASTASVDGWTALDPEWLVGLGSAAAARTPFSLEALDGIVLAAWAISASLALAALAGGLLSLRARARGWRPATVEGEEVLVSDGFGPALVGIASPKIAVPRWALRLSPEELRLTWLHEAEHREAGDAWVLLAGALSVALMPWNPALWWQMGRLRTSVELDCDARVLARGASRKTYGRLLLALGSGRGPHLVPVPALAKSRSLLERRMTMIVGRERKRSLAHAVTAGVLSASLVVVACDTAPPTEVTDDGAAAYFATEVAPADEADGVGGEGGTYRTTEAAPAGEVAGILRPLTSEQGGTFRTTLAEEGVRVLVDGVERSDLPDDLDPSRIERIEVRKDTDPPTVQIFTRSEADGPLVYLDGERFEGDPSSLSPESIERVEVLKGETAVERYGEDGADGVILITSRK